MPYPLPPGPPAPGEPDGQSNEPTGPPTTHPARPRPTAPPPFPIEAPARLRWANDAHEGRPRLPQIRGGVPEPEPVPEAAPAPVALPESTLRVEDVVDAQTPAYRVPPRRPSPRSGLLRMGLGVGVSLGVLVACGVVIAGILARDDQATTTAAMPSFSSTPTPDPTAGLTSDPYATGPARPGASGSAEAPSIGPDRLSKDDFAKAWRLHYGAVSLRGQRILAKDYKGCRHTLEPAARGGCRYAVQMTYRALSGRLRMTHIVFDLGSPEPAKKLADKLTVNPNTVKRPPGTALADYQEGWFKAADYGKYVVFTMVTAKQGVPEETGKQFTSYGNTDLGAAILFRL